MRVGRDLISDIEFYHHLEVPLVKKFQHIIFHPLTLLLMSTALWAALSGCAGQQAGADLVLTNGKIITMDDNLPEAAALAVREGRIAALGSAEEIAVYIGDNTRVIDLQGRLAIPGFIESHAHARKLGMMKISLDVSRIRSWEEMVAQVREAAAKQPPGSWIFGRGWHQEKWENLVVPTVQGFPYHHDLSAAAPDHPVWLRSANGHAAYANAKAMELAGISRETPDPPGGVIVRDEHGDAIGVFLENAEDLITAAKAAYDRRRSPEAIREEEIRMIQQAEAECLRKGITSFQDAGSTFETIDLFKELAESGALRVRFWIMIGDSLERIRKLGEQYRMINVGGDHFLTVRAIKQYIDGALGSRGAWLLAPYSDQPQTSGLNTVPLEELRATAELALAYQLQLCVHAIGDRGNREMLDIYQKVFQDHPEQSGLRWRIEHAQHLDPSDIPRFAELGLIASMQGVHCTSDGPWVPKRIGEERAETGAYVWRKLLEAGAVIANGTDAPVEDVDPLANFYSSVTRRMSDGRQFYPGQVMTREEALRTYTVNAAYAAFEEDIKGSLIPGKLADITVLSRDIMAVPAEEIPGTEVVYTIVGGEVAYGKE